MSRQAFPKLGERSRRLDKHNEKIGKRFLVLRFSVLILAPIAKS
jgi:hypothetical protein